MEPIQTIGKLLKGGEQRDCIHIAVMPAIADADLRRGDEVALVYGTTDQVTPKDSVYGIKTIGIVDPFFNLSALGQREPYRWEVKKGERCWVFLYPGSVTGMRHHWTHPDIDDQKPPANESEKWLRQFADRWNFDYDEMIAIGSNGSVPISTDLPLLGRRDFDTDFITARGVDLHGAAELGDDYGLFWHHLECLTGKKFDEEHREKVGWSCTC